MLRLLFALLMLLAVPLRAEGTLVQLKDFPSINVAPRNVSIWLPPGYDPKGKRLPVIYMHDGQNLFDPATAYGGKTWGVSEALTALAAAGKTRRAIIVGVWNSPRRYQEYFPEKLVAYLPADRQAQVRAGGPLLGDAYLKFLVTELKPYIDAHYATLTGPRDTSTMGSSMGGLISVYALTQYPQVFGQAAGLSVHWPLTDPSRDNAAADADAVAAAFGQLFAASKSRPSANRLYVDHGDQTLDSFYAPYAERIDAVLAKAGWTPPNYVSRSWPGAAHNEDSWRARIDVPLTFLLGAPN